MQNDFLPSTLAGWVGLIGSTLTVASLVVAGVLKWVRGPLLEDQAQIRREAETRAKDQGERIGRVESHCERNETKVQDLEKAVDVLQLSFLTQGKTMERMDAHLQQLLRQVGDNHENRMKESRFVGERLARIETKLDIPLQRATE